MAATSMVLEWPLSVAPYDLGYVPPAGLAESVNRMVGLYRERQVELALQSDFDNRFHKAVSFMVPFLQRNLPRRPRHVLEIGCGKGAKSMPLSLLCDQYHGLDLNPAEIDYARAAAERLEIGNATFVVDAAADLEAFLARSPVRFDLIILYAIVEHLTVPEKLGLLRVIWNYLDDDGHLWIGEAPNRMHGVDYHSSRSLWFQQMPMELWREYLPRAQNKVWRDQIAHAFEKRWMPHAAYRRGIPVGHQEFDLALMPMEQLEAHIVADSYDVNLLNLSPFDLFEFLRLAELRSFASFPEGVGIEPRSFPDFFSRYYLEVLLSKRPRPVARPRIEADLPWVQGAGSLFGEDRSRAVRPGEPMEIALPKGDASSFAVSVYLDRTMQAGRFTVRASDGAVVAEVEAAPLVHRFARWRQKLAVALPVLGRDRFPLRLEPLAGARPVHVVATFARGVD